MRTLIFEAPSEDWEPFYTESRPALGGAKPVLGRGINWIAGSVQTTGQDVNSVSFNLDVLPTSAPKRLGELGVFFAQLASKDYLHVKLKGTVMIDGKTFDVESEGLTSVHYGTRLPSYGWGSTIPNPHNPGAPRVFFSSMRGDNLRVGKKLLQGKALTYSYGQRIGWGLKISEAKYDYHTIPLCGFWLWKTTLELTNTQMIKHKLLGADTITATAEAALCGWYPIWNIASTWFRNRKLTVGRMALDFRGAEYFNELGLSEPPD